MADDAHGRERGSWRLRELAWPLRLSLSLLCVVLLGGMAFSARHMVSHYENRDGTAGMSLDDVRGAYHGVSKVAPMLRILEAGHEDPAADAGLSEDDRATLLEWLSDNDRISGDYDNIDLGAAAPAEIIDRACLECHARNASAGGDIGQTVPLEYWDDVESVAFSTSVSPTEPAIVIASLHTHALSLGTLGVVVVLLLAATRLPRLLVHVLVVAMSVGLAADLGSWLLARGDVRFVWSIVLGGATFGAATCIALLLVLVDLWWPRRT